MDGLTLPTWMRGANTKALAAPIIIIIIIITVVTKLIEDLVPKLLPLATLQKVLQNLLPEGIHIRDLRTIVETLAENASHHQDAGDLTSLVRIALGRAIVQQLFPNGGELSVMALDNRLERLLMQALQTSGPDGAGIEPGLADTLVGGQG